MKNNIIEVRLNRHKEFAYSDLTDSYIRQTKSRIARCISY